MNDEKSPPPKPAASASRRIHHRQADPHDGNQLQQRRHRDDMSRAEDRDQKRVDDAQRPAREARYGREPEELHRRELETDAR
jgi:hypothetical protein